MIGPRKPSCTSFGARPQWSTWAWVEQHGVEIAEPERAGLPIAGQVRPLLIHAAIDQQPGAVGLDVVLRAGHLPAAPRNCSFTVSPCGWLSVVGCQLSVIRGIAARRQPAVGRWAAVDYRGSGREAEARRPGATGRTCLSPPCRVIHHGPIVWKSADLWLIASRKTVKP